MILVKQEGNLYTIRFKYDVEIIALIKQIPGRQWDLNNRYWTIPLDKLGFMIAQFKATPFESQLKIESNEHLNENSDLGQTREIPDWDLSDVRFYVKEGLQLFNHQKDCMKYYLWRRNNGYHSGFLLADEPGCISGSAIIRIQEDGKTWTRECKLHRAYEMFRSGQSFKIKSMTNGRFSYMKIADIVDKGTRETITISMNGYSLKCTPDHEIYTDKGWLPADQIQVGDKVFANGEKYRCPICGSTDDIVSYKYSKFKGLCRKCMYASREGTKYKGDKVFKQIDSDGYVRLKGKTTRKSPLYSVANGEGIYEHHQVWYDNTGHIVDTSKESIHHINHIKTDNRFENLQLLSISEHSKIHADTAITHLPQNKIDAEFYYCHGVKTWIVPHLVEVTNIEYSGQDHVYDVVIDHPEIHNFVANGLIVHNCGKTLEVLNIGMWKKDHLHSKHCLIIACVNSAKYNWVEDIVKHTNGLEHPYILGSRLRRDGRINCSGSGKDKLEDLITGKMYGKKGTESLPYFIVTNIESLRTSVGRTKVITNELIRMINEGEIDTIAVDEIHKNASPSSMQGKQLLTIKKKISAQIEWIPMTGTPITSKPTDVFTPLRLVDGHSSSSYWDWCRMFCVYGGYGGKEIIGYKNVPYLKTLLQPNMLRRLKKDILDLPPKVYHTEYVENTAYQQRLYQSVLTDLVNRKDEIVSSMNPMTQLLRLRQVNGSPELVDKNLIVNSHYLSCNAKFHRALELIEDITSCNEKVVVFSNWVEPLRTFYKFISVKHKVCCYTGTMSSDERERQKQLFINNPEYQIMIGTVGALGTSHTLTVASNIIFLDECWNPSDQSQAEDRCARAGQTSTVNIYTIITKDTVDERVHDILNQKDGVAKFIVDNELDLRKNPSLFDMLTN